MARWLRRLDVGEGVCELEARHAHLVGREAVEHEGIVGVRAVGDGDFLDGGDGVRHGRRFPRRSGSMGKKKPKQRLYGPGDGGFQLTEWQAATTLGTAPAVQRAVHGRDDGDLDCLAGQEGQHGYAPRGNRAEMEKMSGPRSAPMEKTKKLAAMPARTAAGRSARRPWNARATAPAAAAASG